MCFCDAKAMKAVEKPQITCPMSQYIEVNQYQGGQFIERICYQIRKIHTLVRVLLISLLNSLSVHNNLFSYNASSPDKILPRFHDCCKIM